MKDGDDGFEEFYRRVFWQAVRVATGITGSSALGEDMAAEAMARAFSRWRRLRHLDHREAWLMRVTINLSLREAVRRPPIAEDGVSADFENLAAQRLDVVRAMGSLPRRQREVMALRYLGGLSEDEIATRLHLSLGTVKSHTHRAVVSLRTQLAHP